MEVYRELFDRAMSSSRKRQTMKSFCQKTRDSRSLDFLEDLSEYRNMNFEERMVKMNQIIDKYLLKTAPRRLKVPVDVELDSILNGSGQLELFDVIQEKVTNSIVSGSTFKNLVKSSAFAD
ncbi:SUPT20H [Acrasis kona]